MKGGHLDNYYYQLVDFVRRYKGASPPPNAGPDMRIDMDGSWSQWDEVNAEYRDDIGDTAHRDHDGWNRFKRYVNATGRNDFVQLKVARDEKNLYFYAQTQAPITPSTDPNWMMLRLQIDGVSYVLNAEKPDGQYFVLQAVNPDRSRSTIARVRYRTKGTRLVVAIPRDKIGLGPNRRNFEIDFKWADNVRSFDDAEYLIQDGDTAPNGRFMYRYIVR
jgi:hypothetical protein